MDGDTYCSYDYPLHSILTLSLYTENATKRYATDTSLQRGCSYLHRLRNVFLLA
jgi:hypothetical protein